ncbi:molecular chaperone SurA [Methylovorus sp. MM2]|uniref:peptidylprolyl isomerase n=1 Tax=Methylovorus sp. MM2 TaxID=1848038 RepID=UPI0007DF6037|nr:peptidylprolyl isomerase [Methylovorus sp. MM2]OAM51417.1 molecular chaperone SurA [Methylovorus sp. MM2]
MLSKYSIPLFFSLLGLMSFAHAQVNDTAKIDRIVAVVDQAVITENELADRIRVVSNQLEKQGTQLPPHAILEKQILERLINDTLQLQYAAQTGLRVDDNQLDKTVERIAEQNKMTVPEFREALSNEGITYRKFREDIRTEILLARLREREVDNRVNVTETEVDNYFTTQSSRTDSQDEYEVSHILIRAREESTPEELQKLKTKAEQAMKQLQAGTDFAQVSVSFSDAPNAIEGGSLGWKKSGQLPALFTEALQKLQPGQLTPILRSPNGFHILKLTNRRGGTSPLVIDQTHPRHILVKLSEVVSESDAKHKVDSIKERLDNGANFSELARQYSEDGSANNGGDLGWVNPGDTVPQFEQAMNALKINQISDPIRTPFGWHIIQVVERRTQDMSRESARMKARQEIRSRKADEAYQDWVRELRDRAYVELRLEDKF